MPKVYITQEQRDREKINRVIRSRMAFLGIKGREMASMLGISHQKFSYCITHGSITMADFIALHRILHFTASDMESLIGRFGKEGLDG